MRAAAGETGDDAAEAADAREIAAATGTAVEVTADSSADEGGEIVAAHLIGDAEIAAGLFPFGAMRKNAAAAGAKLGEEMGQLVAQRPLDFAAGVADEEWIERDQPAARVGPAGAGLQARVPFDLDLRGDRSGAGDGQKVAHLRFKMDVASGVARASSP